MVVPVECWCVLEVPTMATRRRKKDRKKKRRRRAVDGGCGK